jgi:hypothetical protein
MSVPYNGGAVGAFTGDAVGSHQHRKANVYAPPGTVYSDALSWATVTGGSAWGDNLFTSPYGEYETRPASISASAYMTY